MVPVVSASSSIPSTRHKGRGDPPHISVAAADADRLTAACRLQCCGQAGFHYTDGAPRSYSTGLLSMDQPQHMAPFILI